MSSGDSYWTEEFVWAPQNMCPSFRFIKFWTLFGLRVGVGPPNNLVVRSLKPFPLLFGFCSRFPWDRAMHVRESRSSLAALFLFSPSFFFIFYFVTTFFLHCFISFKFIYLFINTYTLLLLKLARELEKLMACDLLSWQSFIN